MDNEQLPIKRAIEYCDKCKRRCIFYDDKCQGCFLTLVDAIERDARLLER